MRSGEAPSDRRPLRLGTLRLQNRFHEPCALNRLPNGPPEIPRYVSRGDFIGNSPCYVSRGDFIGGAVNRCRPDRSDQRSPLRFQRKFHWDLDSKPEVG
jgi:hypothetical protein